MESARLQTPAFASELASSFDSKLHTLFSPSSSLSHPSHHRMSHISFLLVENEQPFTPSTESCQRPVYNLDTLLSSAFALPPPPPPTTTTTTTTTHSATQEHPPVSSSSSSSSSSHPLPTPFVHPVPFSTPQPAIDLDLSAIPTPTSLPVTTDIVHPLSSTESLLSPSLHFHKQSRVWRVVDAKNGVDSSNEDLSNLSGQGQLKVTELFTQARYEVVSLTTNNPAFTLLLTARGSVLAHVHTPSLFKTLSSFHSSSSLTPTPTPTPTPTTPATPTSPTTIPNAIGIPSALNNLIDNPANPTGTASENEQDIHPIASGLETIPLSQLAHPCLIPALQLERALRDKRFVAVAGGESFSVVLAATGEVYTWGTGKEGELGLNSIIETAQPCLCSRLIPYHIVQIACGSHHTVALDSQGRVFTWGSNVYGQLGQGDKANRSEPTQVAHLARIAIRAVAAGNDFTICLDATGRVFAFGRNQQGQCGNATGTAYLEPVCMRQFPDRVLQVACGDSHSIALCDNNQVVVWGCGAFGECGVDYSVMYASAPQKVPLSRVLLEGEVVTAVRAGGHRCAILTNQGRVIVWGEHCGSQPQVCRAQLLLQQQQQQQQQQHRQGEGVGDEQGGEEEEVFSNDDDYDQSEMRMTDVIVGASTFYLIQNHDQASTSSYAQSLLEQVDVGETHSLLSDQGRRTWRLSMRRGYGNESNEMRLRKTRLASAEW